MKKLAVLFLSLAVVSFASAAPSTLVYGTTEKLTDLDTGSSWDFHTWEYFQNISEGLLTYTPGTTNLVPGLAEKYTANATGDEYTFTLRKGLKFSNGDVLDAAAVKWSVDRVVALKGDPESLISSYVSEVIVKDPLTIVFKLKLPAAYFPSLVATPPYFPQDPKVYPVDKLVHDPSELVGGAYVGAGAYKLVSYKRDQEAVFEKNPNFHGQAGKVDRIIIRYYADATTLRLALDKGEVDLAYKSLNPSDIVDELKNKSINTLKLDGAQIRYLAFENSESVFKDKNLRQAVSLLVNRPEILQKVYLGQNKPLYSMIPNGMQWQDLTFKNKAEPNVAAAEAILKKAGYTKDKPFEFDLWYTTSHYGDTEVNQAEVLKSQLEKTPLVKVTIKSAEWATYKTQWKKKQMPVYLLGWYPDYIDPDDYTAVFARTEDSAGMGIYYSNKDMDALFAKEGSSPDAKVRADAFKKIQALWATEAPTIPLWQGDLFVFTKKNVGGVKIGPTLIFNYNQLTLTK
jgi:peptide/nickel transport system substrate-binding protein